MEAFLQLFNKHADVKSNMDAAISIRLSHAHIRIGELTSQLNEKSQECSLLQESVNNVDTELREAEVIKSRAGPVFFDAKGEFIKKMPLPN